MAKAIEEKRAIVAEIEARPPEVSVEDACKLHGISDGTFYYYRSQVQEHDANCNLLTPECYEDVDAMIDALVDDGDDTTAAAVNDVINAWVDRIEILLNAESAKANLAGRLLDEFAQSIRGAMEQSLES